MDNFTHFLTVDYFLHFATNLIAIHLCGKCVGFMLSTTNEKVNKIKARTANKPFKEYNYTNNRP